MSFRLVIEGVLNSRVKIASDVEKVQPLGSQGIAWGFKILISVL